MGLEQRSYGGKLFRPTPEVEIADDLSFGAIITPWGPRQSATRGIETLRDYVLSARQDLEATSPFQKLSCLSTLANSLRVAAMLVNDSIYREENKAEYTSGVELLIFARNENEMAFAQVGCPNLILARKGLPLIPLAVQIDLSTEMSQTPEILSPLPHNLVGLHTTSNLTVSSIRLQPGDKFVFLSHSLGAQPFSALTFNSVNISTLSESLARQNPELPFWLGVLDL